MGQYSVIEASGLSCLSGSQYLLKDINWHVQEGERWVVFGRNGCGKTTLLSTIAGYQKYSEGSLKVFNKEYRNDNILDIRKQIGWISSSFFDKNYRSESVLDIVLSGVFGTLGLNFNIDDKHVVKAKQLLRNLGLKAKMNAPFNLLSKGERQHVLIARAFLTEPQVLILDEPCTGLDVLAREKFLYTIDSLAQETAMTMIYVTHYPEEVLPVFDRCLLLRYGAVYHSGNTADLFSDTVMSDFLNYPIHVEQTNGRYKFGLAKSCLTSILNNGEG
jgi:iron complex transport system ATP-binding protein